MLARIFKAKTIGADRPAAPPKPAQTMDEQIAMALRWSAVVPPLAAPPDPVEACPYPDPPADLDPLL